MENKQKIILATVLLLALLFPLFQLGTKLFIEHPLNGSFEPTEKPDWNSDGWWSGNFQQQYKTYFKEQVGFSSFLVRLHHQIQYSIFDQVHTQDVVIGKNHVLYDDRHIQAMLGKDFIGVHLIQKNTRQLKAVSDSLAVHGKQILVVLAPNKARYFKEEVPGNVTPIGPTNYANYLEQFRRFDIQYIDVNEWFLTQKTKHAIPYIPKYGIHWSEYAASLVEDSIINYCNLNFGYDLPRYQTIRLTKTNEASDLDYDLGKSLNLFQRPTDDLYLYPEKEVVQGEKKNVLAIGDSYFKMLYLTGFTEDIFNSDGLWYYNREVLKKGLPDQKPPGLANILPQTDVVIILLTEWNLYRLGFGIIEEIDSYYTGKKIESNAVRYFINRIRADQEWLEGERIKAKERGISLDTMVVKTARYMVRMKEEKD